MTTAPTARRWLLGPAPDLLLGCGVGYALVLAGLIAARPSGDWVALAQVVILLTSVPHYGATMLRAFQAGSAHRRFALLLTVPMVALYAVASHQVAVASVLVTLYLTWSPWHYSSQNYGISLMFLRRRGVAVSPLARRCLRASFVLSFLLVTITMHAQGAVPPEDPAYLMGGDVRFIPLGIPHAVHVYGFAAVALADAAAIIAAAVLLLRAGKARDLLPTALIAAVQIFWFTIPTFLRNSNWSPEWSGANSYLLIAVGHSVQYLWIATFSARSSNRASYFGATLLAGSALWVIPALLFGPGALGRFPWDMGLAIVTSAAVNLHHFILDGVIWKLREPAVAKVLIENAGEPAPERRRRWALATVGALSLAASVFAVWESEFGFRRAWVAGDVERLQQGVTRLAAIGRDGPRQRVALGMLLSKRGDADGALREFARSRELHPMEAASLAEALVYDKRGEREAALKAYRAALELNPRSEARLRIPVLEAALAR